jgi:hypothetical protein
MADHDDRLAGEAVSALDYLSQLVDRGGYSGAAGRLGDAAGRVAGGPAQPTLADLSRDLLVPPGARRVLSGGPVGVASRVDALRQADFDGATLGRE